MGCQKWLRLCAPIFLTYFWRSRWCGRPYCWLQQLCTMYIQCKLCVLHTQWWHMWCAISWSWMNWTPPFSNLGLHLPVAIIMTLAWFSTKFLKAPILLGPVLGLTWLKLCVIVWNRDNWRSYAMLWILAQLPALNLKPLNPLAGLPLWLEMGNLNHLLFGMILNLDIGLLHPRHKISQKKWKMPNFF